MVRRLLLLPFLLAGCVQPAPPVVHVASNEKPYEQWAREQDEAEDAKVIKMIGGPQKSFLDWSKAVTQPNGQIKLPPGAVVGREPECPQGYMCASITYEESNW